MKNKFISLVIFCSLIISCLAYAQASDNDYSSLLAQKISYLLVYPQKAREQNWEGIVKVKFLINKDGSIEAAEIAQSSGYPLLDRSALWAVENASPYPFPFSDKESLSVEIPLEFKLKQKNVPKTPDTVPAALTEQEYKDTVLENIMLILPYPGSAKKQGLQGTARVKLFIDEQGRASEVKTVRSSGNKDLDQAALWAIEHAQPLPSSLFLGRKKTSLELDIQFKAQAKRKKKKAESSKTVKKASLPKKTEKEPVPQKPDHSLYAQLDLKNVFAKELPEELKKFITIAIDNNPPLQAAKKEVELAELKLEEAKRNLYPSLKFQVYNTDGTTNLVDYQERELKAQVDHPLYYAGKLKNAYEQAKINLALTKRNYDQQVLDTINKTEVAYYTLVSLRMNLKKQQEIIKEAEKILKITQKQAEKGVIIPLELNNVLSWHSRLTLMRDTIAQELELAYLTFTQVLNAQASPEINLFALPMKEFGLKLPRCIYCALESRPEINLARLTVEFQEYQKKIVDAQDNFNVDMTWSWGYYEGHYITEPWKSASNWYVGFKATKPLGKNTLTTSVNKESQRPKYGESHPTDSQTMSAELGVLDNYKFRSDQKKAEVELLKAKSDLEETQKNITFEVQDAFFKHQKALLEVKSAGTQKEFREQETKINKARVYRGEGSFPNLIETLVDFSEAENTYLRALGSYYISVSSLRKATGFGIEF